MPMIKYARNLLESAFTQVNMSAEHTSLFAQILVIVGLFILFSLFAWALRHFVIPLVLKFVEKTETKWDDYLVNKPVLNALSQIIPCSMVYALLPLCFDNAETSVAHHVISHILQAYICVCVILLITSFLKNLSLAMTEHLDEHHLTGVIQFLRLATCFIGAIIAFSLLLGFDPIRAVAGLGAAATVLLLVFKDSILGLVAGIQLSLNKMLQVGDWITIDKLNVNGIVKEISLTTVKVQNFDNTTSTIPPYTLVSDSFQNWRSMTNDKARRVKRALYIDVNTIRYLNVEEKQALKRKQLITSKDYKSEANLTNLTVFRHYIEQCLNEDNNVVRGPFLLVRQLPPTPNGLPLELWYYYSVTKFEDFEDLASTRIENIIALLQAFDLKLFQQPTGTDFTSVIKRSDQEAKH